MNPVSIEILKCDGMFAVLVDSIISVNHILWATGLNLFFFGVIVAWFYHTFNVCKEKGMLVRVGE